MIKEARVQDQIFMLNKHDFICSCPICGELHQLNLIGYNKDNHYVPCESCHNSFNVFTAPILVQWCQL